MRASLPRNWAPIALTAAHDPELAVIAVRAVVALTPVPFADYVFARSGGGWVDTAPTVIRDALVA